MTIKEYLVHLKVYFRLILSHISSWKLFPKWELDEHLWTRPVKDSSWHCIICGRTETIETLDEE